MTIILQEGDVLHALITAEGNVIKREDMREYRLSDGRIALDCGECNTRLKAKSHVIDKDGILSEWGAA